MKVFPLLRGASGLNTRIDPARLQDANGVSELAEAVNVDISPSNRINRRKGYAKVCSLPTHSLYATGSKKEALFVSDYGLYLLSGDFSYRLLATLKSNERMDFCKVGEKIYYVNGTDFGYILDGVRFPWKKEHDYVGPTTQKVMSGPFTGNHIEYHYGRIYVSREDVIWYSEWNALSWFDMARNFIPFDSKVRMIKSVNAGIFVSTEKGIYFLQGKVPKDFVLNKVYNYPALEWSCSINYLDNSVFWITKNGLMEGKEDGSVKELNRVKVIYPEGNKGACLIRDIDIVHTLD